MCRVVSESISVTLKAKMQEAKLQHNEDAFPAFIEIVVESARLTVSSDMKNFMVRADKECFEWIISTLRAEIEKKTQFEASSQSEDLSPTTPYFSFSKALTGIRGNVRKLESSRSSLEARLRTLIINQ